MGVGVLNAYWRPSFWLGKVISPNIRSIKVSRGQKAPTLANSDIKV